jgi:toxin ParE1/3/4
MTEYRLTKAAEDDLLDMFIYGFETFGRRKAEEYRRRMIRCFNLLAENPRLGRGVEQFAAGARRHEHAQHVIFYDEQPYDVRIIGIVHVRSIHRLLDD